MVAGALALLARERLVPWLAERSIVDPGDPVGAELALLDAASGRAIALGPDSARLVFVFRSTCEACERASPGWTRLAETSGVAAIAVGLEPAERAWRYARSRLPAARPAVPADPERFTRQLRIRTIPTTLVIDRLGRLVERRVGPLEDRDVDRLGRLLARPSP
jgi:hypothetical protein